MLTSWYSTFDIENTLYACIIHVLIGPPEYKIPGQESIKNTTKEEKALNIFLKSKTVLDENINIETKPPNKTNKPVSSVPNRRAAENPKK